MNKLSYKISYYALYAAIAVTIVVLLLFYLGGNAEGDALVPGLDPAMWQPAQTDALLYLMYVLFGLSVVAAIFAACFQLGSALKDSPVNALKSLLGGLLLVAVLVITWSVGDATTLHIPGYDGDDNVPFWLKITDMFLYSFYVLMGVTIAAIAAGSIKRKIS